MNKIIKMSLAAILLFTVAACSNTQPIHNVNQATVASSLSAADVRTAIVQAATQRGWAIVEDSGSEIVAAINVRTHEAKVRIPYSDNSYSIQYEDSVNLKQRGSSIHRNYNRWVHNLNNDIRRQMNLQMAQ